MSKLTSEELKRWVIDRTGSSDLFDHCEGILLDLIDFAIAKSQEEIN